MKIVNSMRDESVAQALLDGQLVVLRTDTLYGIVARAQDEAAVQRVFAIKGRSDYKSPIVLIADREQMFVPLPEPQRKLSEEVWPGPVTIAIPIDKTTAPAWLHRGNDEFGHRMPGSEELRELIEKTGPLIAPSANPESDEPASTIEEAVAYFGDDIAVYVDGGQVIDPTPSKLLRIDEQGNIERLR